MVGAHLVIAPPRRLHRQVRQQRQPAQPRLRHLLQRLLPSAEDEARPLAVEVERRGEVDRQRQPLGQAAVPGREPDPALLALDRQVDAGQRRDLVRPGARAADERAAADRPLRGVDGRHPPGFHAHAGHLTALADVDPTRVPLDDRLRGGVPVELAEGRRQQAVRLELGDDRERLLHRQLPRGNAQPVLERERLAERGDVLVPIEQEQVAVAAEVDPLHPLELGHRAESDPDVQLVGELRADPAGRTRGRTGRERVALEQHDVFHTQLAQVPRDARPHRAAAHDHHLVRLHAP